MVDYFISDTHFCHKNILKYDDRPFSSIEEHDEALIANWNSVVRRNDAVYHLGDFGFAPVSTLEEIVRRLNGKIRLIRGNHDKNRIIAGMEWVKDQAIVKVDGKKVALCHYSFYNPPRCHVQLHGHSHGKLSHRYVWYTPEVQVPTYNLYVGLWNWMPVPLEVILKEPIEYKQQLVKL